LEFTGALATYCANNLGVGTLQSTSTEERAERAIVYP